MFRFIIYAVPLLLLELALFGFAVELLDVEPRGGSVIRLALLEQPAVPGKLVFGTWLVEISGLIAMFLLAQGRFNAWWLDGLVAGWVAWVFRGPLLVITIVVAARQPHDPWWTLAFGWWVLYSVCGLSLAVLAKRSGLGPWATPEEPPSLPEETAVEPPPLDETLEAPSVETEDPEGATEEASVETEVSDDQPEPEPAMATVEPTKE
ncbi:MAG: hypothetical protein GY719_28960 [bacterium]|nr:hypothetical protein [bacterium]